MIRRGARGDTAHVHLTAVKEISGRECRTTRLAVQAVRLRGWLAVTEERCDGKLAAPFN